MADDTERKPAHINGKNLAENTNITRMFSWPNLINVLTPPFSTAFFSVL